MIAIDTNLLVYALDASAPEQNAAKRALQMARDDPRGWGVALPCVAEFWNVVTRSAGLKRPATPAEARDFLSSLIVEAGAVVWTPGEGFWERLTQLAADRHVHGRRIFDLQIVLAAFENGATEIWTHDHEFKAMPGIRVRDPL